MAQPAEHRRVVLPNGQHAVLRMKVSVRGRKALERTMVPAMAAQRRLRRARALADTPDGEKLTTNEQLSYTEDEIYRLQRFEMAGVLATVVQWSLDDPLPRSIDDVEDMDPEDYEAIAVEIRPDLWDLIGHPKTGVDNALKDGKRDLDSPTGPSSDSPNGELAGTAAPQPSSESPTETSTSGSESTDFVDVTPV